METPAKEASQEEAVETETPQTEQSEESVVDETLDDGGDADPLKKVIADKDRHITKLEDENRKLKEDKPKAKISSEDSDDVMVWMTANADDMKLVSKEFQEELKFYKDHKISITNELRDRALRDARARKGVNSKKTEESDRQVATASAGDSELRAGESEDIPPRVKEILTKAFPKKEITKEDYKRWKAENDARRK